MFRNRELEVQANEELLVDAVSSIFDEEKLTEQQKEETRPYVLNQLRAALEKFDGKAKSLIDKRILVVGCGSRDTADNKPGSRFYEPWFCRTMHKLGAKVVGVDKDANKDEKFENYQEDLSKTNSLAFLPENSFDGVQVSLLLASPSLRLDIKQKFEMAERLATQIKRLLKKSGKIIFVDVPIQDYLKKTYEKTDSR